MVCWNVLLSLIVAIQYLSLRPTMLSVTHETLLRVAALAQSIFLCSLIDPIVL